MSGFFMSGFFMSGFSYIVKEKFVMLLLIGYICQQIEMI